MTHNPFDAYRYDDNFVLRVSPTLWLIIIWSIHHALLLSLAAFSNSGQVFGAVLDYAASLPLLMSDIPGVMVLAARLNRKPDAGTKIRWLWSHGIELLILGLSISITATVNAYRQELASPDNPAFWIVAVNLGVIAYLVWSRGIREIFADFPSPTEAVEDSKSAVK